MKSSIVIALTVVVLLTGASPGTKQLNEKKMKIIYVMDPLCGWCYGNTTNTEKLYEKYGNRIDFEILPAGMWTGANARYQSRQTAVYIKKHDLQVAQLTGTTFGEGYFKLLEDEKVLLDSEIPSRAITTIKNMWPAQAIPFAIRVQRARYWYGKDLNKESTYFDICTDLKLDTAQFLNAFHSEELKRATQEGFVSAQRYASSYPTLLSEMDGKTIVLEQGYASFQSITNQIDTLLY